MDELTDRILGSLCLAGMGDALGAQTEQWTIEEIEAHHGGLVTAFGDPPPDTFAGANGGRRAEVTDDASQMYYLARALIEGGGRLDQAAWVRCLLDWAATSPKARYMGPSTALVVRALQEGTDLAQVGTIGSSLRKMSTMGNTNGAAMRVAPCGLVHPGRAREACELAFVTCLPTHDTTVAVASAACIAAGVAQALVRPRLADVLAACVQGAEWGARIAHERGCRAGGATVASRLTMALEIAAAGYDDRRFLREIEQRVGNSVLAAESVPAAVGVLAQAGGDPLRTISLASSIGNDTDTIATMAGAMAGAMHGARALPRTLHDDFRAVNDAEYGLDALAAGLASIARGAT
jgi:ADP-ribosylglycohydrolase